MTDEYDDKDLLEEEEDMDSLDDLKDAELEDGDGFEGGFGDDGEGDY